MISARLDYLPSAARTSAPAALDDQANDEFDGIRVVVDLTAFVTAASLTVDIQGKDPLSGKYFTLLSSGALTATVTKVLTLFPGAPVVANGSANDALPGVWRIVVTHGNGNSHTYSIGVERLKVMC